MFQQALWIRTLCFELLRVWVTHGTGGVQGASLIAEDVAWPKQISEIKPSRILWNSARCDRSSDTRLLLELAPLA